MYGCGFDQLSHGVYGYGCDQLSHGVYGCDQLSHGLYGVGLTSYHMVYIVGVYVYSWQPGEEMWRSWAITCCFGQVELFHGVVRLTNCLLPKPRKGVRMGDRSVVCQ